MNRRSKLEGTKPNLCRSFILPMVGLNYKTMPDNLLNVYITDDYHVITVFDTTCGNVTWLRDWLKLCIRNIRFFKVYEEDVDEMAVYFEVPHMYRPDFDKFLEGKYSKFSSGYKNVIQRFFRKDRIVENRFLTEWDVVDPTNFKRAQIAEWLGVDVELIDEVRDKPDMSRETFKPLSELLNIKTQHETNTGDNTELTNRDKD